jgi:purine nucleosidase
MRTIPVVIDTDPGIDDLVALALALRSLELHIVALTTTYGNTTLERTTRNARDLLSRMARPDVPLFPGADRPLQRPLVTAPETHGVSGIGYATASEVVSVQPDPHALLRALDASAAPVVLLTLGPLTNLALALKADPNRVRTRVRRHLGMFGSLHERGNASRWADFNAWSDPEAVDQVLRAQLGTVMVGLDVTRQMTCTAADVAAFCSDGDSLTRWLGQALQFYVEFHRVQERLDGCVVNDVLPVGQVLAPSLLTLAERRLCVDLGEGDERGRTAERPNGARVQAALGVDVPQMRSLLSRVFALQSPLGGIHQRRGR